MKIEKDGKLASEGTDLGLVIEHLNSGLFDIINKSFLMPRGLVLVVCSPVDSSSTDMLSFEKWPVQSVTLPLDKELTAMKASLTQAFNSSHDTMLNFKGGESLSETIDMLHKVIEFLLEAIKPYHDTQAVQEMKVMQMDCDTPIKPGDVTKPPDLITLPDLKDDRLYLKDVTQALEKLNLPDKKEAMPILINYLMSENPDVCEETLRVMSDLDIDQKDTIPHLIKLLNDKEWLVRFNAVYTLSLIGTDAKDAIKVLIKVLDDDNNSYVSWSAKYALEEIDPLNDGRLD